MYIKSMLLICAFLGGGGGGLEKCSGDRTAGLAVQYHGVGFFFFFGGACKYYATAKTAQQD